jgi:predicted ferric reductase
VVLYIHYYLVLNNNIWQNKIISFEYILLCDVLFSLSAEKKMKIIKKNKTEKKWK